MILFDSSVTAVTILGYPMSWLELIGTVGNIATVWLITKRKIINWPIGIVASALFAMLFFQFRLYADFIENIYYIVTGFWGWWLWTRTRNQDKDDTVIVRNATRREITISLVITGIGTALLGYCIAHINQWLPHYFPESASLPYLDTLTTVMSFVAQILITKRIIFNWHLWIVVDVIGIWLYWHKGLKLISLLYVVFLSLAIKGLVDWRRKLSAQGEIDHEQALQ
jgi:nicotinamide mononucleotide transporter